MINHGLITGALFLLVGVIYERTHDRTIAKMGGLAGADAGLRRGLRLLRLRLGRPARPVRVRRRVPGAASARSRSARAAAAIATFVMILAAGYLLYMYGRVVFGEVSDFLDGPRRPPDRHDPGRDPDARRRSARSSSSSASSRACCSTSSRARSPRRSRRSQPRRPIAIPTDGRRRARSADRWRRRRRPDRAGSLHRPTPQPRRPRARDGGAAH